MSSTILRAWDDDDVAVLAHCVSVGAAQEDAADLLGISMRDYREAIAVFDIRRRPPTPGSRMCLCCGLTFSSSDVTALKCCDPCKATDEWRFLAAALGR